VKVTKERQTELNKLAYAKNKQYFKDKAAKWEKENPEKRRAIARKTKANISALDQKKAWLKDKYNLSWEDFVSLYDSQQGSCKICLKPVALKSTLSEQGKTGHIDHCHSTGKVRGILCNSCNRGIGYLQDNAALLRRAAQYLEETQNQSNQRSS